MRAMPRINILFSTLALVAVLVSCGGGSSKPDEPRMSLLTAIDRGNVTIVEQHMLFGTDPNKDPIPEDIEGEGAFPLHLAVVKGNSEITEMLIAYGADLTIKARNKDGATPLHWAAFFGQPKMVKLLIDAGAPINELDLNQTTPVDAAGIMWILLQLDPEGRERQKLLEEVLQLLKDNGGKRAEDL